LDEKATKLLDGEGKAALAQYLATIDGLGEWKTEGLEEAARLQAEAAGLKLGKIAQPLRAALSGQAVSPPIFTVMQILGRDETLARIRDAVGA
jgi:glutamyl-tRNA synthetase